MTPMNNFTLDQDFEREQMINANLTAATAAFVTFPTSFGLAARAMPNNPVSAYAAVNDPTENGCAGFEASTAWPNRVAPNSE